MKKISIITVVYNAVDTIERTIKSVLEQDYENLEYIIIDGLSNDGTDKVIDKYRSQISNVIREQDDGIYHAMNKGIKIAKGEMIGILNADDWYEEKAISKVMKAFEDEKKDIVYGKVNLFHDNGEFEKIDKLLPLDSLWYTMAVYHPATFVKKSVYDKIGLFNTFYKITADYDFILRCYIEKIKFSYIDEILVNFSLGGASSDSINCAKEHIMVAKKYIKKSPNPQLVEKNLEWRWQGALLNDCVKKNNVKIISIIEKYFEIPKLDKIIIWGTGAWGKRCIDVFINFDVTVYCLVDSKQDKQGKYNKNIIIKSPEEIIHQNDIPILVAVKDFDNQVSNDIIAMGFDKSRFMMLAEWLAEI